MSGPTALRPVARGRRAPGARQPAPGAPPVAPAIADAVAPWLPAGVPGTWRPGPSVPRADPPARSADPRDDRAPSHRRPPDEGGDRRTQPDRPAQADRTARMRPDVRRPIPRRAGAEWPSGPPGPCSVEPMFDRTYVQVSSTPHRQSRGSSDRCSISPIGVTRAGRRPGRVRHGTAITIRAHRRNPDTFEHVFDERADTS